LREPVTAYVGLGANLGDAAAAVNAAISQLDELPDTRVAQVSSLYESAPHEASGPNFVNAVTRIETRLNAMELLESLQRIEAGAGRERPYRNAPRTLDLDLLLYGGGRIDSRALTVPHPRMHERAFVLVPLAEITPALVDPGVLESVADQRIWRRQTL
jgi:2-amino-4-hydroxy-6-hydroxymethyldihydropteridine diphosphokinase